jgi:hypothetical protein
MESAIKYKIIILFLAKINTCLMMRVLVLFSMLSLTAFSSAQLFINEFMAGNVSTLQDEAGEYDDWIELYNPGPAAVSLQNYYITDDYTEPLKFQLPSSVSVAAGGFLIIFADDDATQGNLHANFKLSIDGEELAIFRLSGNDTILIDSLSFSTQSDDISFGRFPDGNAYVEFFDQPTAGVANVSGNLEGIALPPVFSVQGGFFSGTQSIALSSDIPDAHIYYTTNGSEPTSASTLYSAPVTSNTTLILKAKVSADGYLDSKTAVNTYFIDEHFMAYVTSERLPVLSVSCNSEHLYGSQGILTNYEQDWEKLANIEFFEPDGSSSINQYAGIKVYGNASKELEQKSIAAFARSIYGKGSFDYKFFDDKPFDKWESFVMRNGGSDWSLTYFRDALCQALVRNNMYIDAQSSKHAILYLNGEFYGIIDLKEKVNEHYVEMNRGADKDNLDMLSDDQTVIQGDARNYNQYRNFMRNNNMSEPALYKELNRLMDIPNFMNIQIAQIYIANVDMFLNSKFWRERENYGKWRWIMYDTEIGFNQGDYEYTDDYGTSPYFNSLDFATSSDGGVGWPYLVPWSTEKLISILRNNSFKNDFIQTFAVHINTTFKPDRVLGMIDSMQARVRNEIPKQIETYGGHSVDFNPYGTHFTTIEEWEYYVDSMRNFANLRPFYMRSHIIQQYGLEGTYELTASISAGGSGNLYIQGIRIPEDSTGIYFKNIPLKLTVKPDPGYRFVRWEGVSGIDSTSSEISISLSQNTSIEAIFEPEGQIMFTEIFYKSTAGSGVEFIEIYNPKHATSVDISNYEISGEIDFQFPAATVIGPEEYMVITANADQISAGSAVKIFEWTTGSLADTAGTIVLKNSLNATIDSVNYLDDLPWPQVADNYSIELSSVLLDNNAGENWKGSIYAAGAPGVPSLPEGILDLKINEFLANNADFYADENNEYNDWIEILNTGDETVNLNGLYFTNNLTTPSFYQIRGSSSDDLTINPGEHKVIWADGDTGQGPLHLGFKLASAGGHIGISGDGRTFIDSLVYTDQNTDISYGRYTDGANSWRSFTTPTPGDRNSIPPVFTSTPVLTGLAGESYEYIITWDDEDGDELVWGRTAMPYWLSISGMTENSALLSGVIPIGSQKTYNVGYFITDGYSSPVSQTFTITKETTNIILHESIAENSFVCYPNPSEGIFNLEVITEGKVVRIDITNIDGKNVFSSVFNAEDYEVKETINMSSYNNGLYFISVQTIEGTSTQKILIY